MTAKGEAYKIDTMRLFCRDGVWYVSLRHNHKKSLHTKDAADAKRIFRRIKREVLMGRVIDLDTIKSVKLSVFTAEYISWAETIKAPASVRSDALALRTLQEHVGDRHLIAITARILDQEFHAAVLAMGASVSTLNTYIRRVRAALNRAVEWGYLERNPYAATGRRSVLYAEEERIPRYLELDEMRHLFTVIENGAEIKDRELKADQDFARMIRFYLLSGCRRTELVRLRWADVRRQDGYILIAKTKTRRERILHLSQALAGLLGEIRRTKSPYVFPRWRSPDAVSRKFHRYVDAAGIPPCRLHDLRHTAASYLAMADVPTETIAKLLGHTDARTTRIYAHLSPAYQAGVMDKLGQTMAKGMGQNIRSIKGGKK